MKPLKLSGNMRVIDLDANRQAIVPDTEWDVYVNGAHVGTVCESRESLARCAALSKFEIPLDADFSVSQR